MRKLFAAHDVSATTSSHPHAVRRLCVGSAESEDQQVRSRHLVQVQSPVSTALLSIYIPSLITGTYRYQIPYCVITVLINKASWLVLSRRLFRDIKSKISDH